MPRTKKPTPTNNVRTFNLTLDWDVFQGLKELEGTECFGLDLDHIAEGLVLSWFRRHKDYLEKKYSLSQEHAETLGYISSQPCRARRTFYEQTTPDIKMSFRGLPLYFIDMLPKVEHTLHRNQFYQKAPEDVMDYALRKELMRSLVMIRRWEGDED